jgi:GMP synthase (glutamine-hydrolysing)
MKPVLLVVCGDPPPDLEAERGGYDAWFAATIDGPTRSVDARTQRLPDPSSYSAIVVSGSGSGVHEELPWMVEAARWLISHDLPTLGVCFGHQLLAFAHGGVVRPQRPEYGVYDVEIVAEDPLFSGLSNPFAAFESHFDAVVEVPENARVLARSDRAVQALAFGDRVRGVQFHPEFDPVVVDSALRRRGEQLEALEPGHVGRGRSSLRELPEMRQVMTNFFDHFVKG